MLFDSHAHLDDERFNEDRDALIASMPENGISYVMNASANPDDLERIIKIADKYPFVYASVGAHPEYASCIDDNTLVRFASLAKHPKVRAVGEIGLDYHYDNISKDDQKFWFEKQMDLAHDLSLPVIIHDRDAHEDCLKILKDKKVNKIGGILHCFSGSVEMAKRVLDMGMYVSFAGPVTFKNAAKLVDVAKFVPLDRLLIETDSPYLSPEPNRGKRNSPLNVRYVAEKIAQLKGISFEEVAEATVKNAKDIFKIK